MIDFNKITSEELRELKIIAGKAVEKSELERYYLFTSNINEKAKIVIFCNRFLINIYNMLEDSDLRIAIKDTLNEMSITYNKLLVLIELNVNINYNKHLRETKIFALVNTKEVDDIIDLFSVLTEKANVIQVSKLKGFLLEGKSGQEYKKVFKPVTDLS